MTNDTLGAPAVGGADWEVGEAARKFSTALGLDDDRAAAVTAAMSDHAAAVGSKSTQMISALFARLYEMQEATRGDVARLAQQQTTLERTWERRFDYMLGENTRFIQRADKRLDVFATQIDDLVEGQGKVLGALTGIDVRVGVLESDVEAFKQESRAHRMVLEATTDLLQSTINDIQTTVDQLPETEQLKVVRQVRKEVRQLRTLVLILLAIVSIIVIAAAIRMFLGA